MSNQPQKAAPWLDDSSASSIDWEQHHYVDKKEKNPHYLKLYLQLLSCK